MSSKMVSQEQIARIEAAMKNAPKIDGPLTVADAVKKLSGSIKAMRGRGYDWQQIADVLRTEGVAISAATLRRYCTPKRTTAETKLG